MIYEYRCKKCNHKFEKLVRLEDRAQAMPCENPDCDNKECTKLLSMFGKHLSWSKWRALD